MEITANLIKELREKSGAGMMDCKKALNETAGDIEQAIDWLRKKGLSIANKKADRVTAEGLVVVEVSGNTAVMLEINSETDFVARNEQFQQFVKQLAKTALKSDGTIEHLKTLSFEGSKTVEESLVSLISTIGENISIRRMKKIESDTGIASYIHNAIVEGLGKIGVLITLTKQVAIDTFIKQLAMHIAANKPKSLDIISLDKDIVEREKSVQREMALQTGKPKEIVEKMLEGKIAKFYQEVCLLEQPFVMDPDKNIAKVLKEHDTTIKEYAYFILGEGIEKHQIDFAEEVAKTIQG